MDLKNVRRGRIKEYSDKFKTAVYSPIDPKLDYNPLWNHKAHCAFPSATQNEINGKDAEHLLKNGVYVIGEGCEHAEYDRRGQPLPRREDPLRAGQRPPTPAALPPRASRCVAEQHGALLSRRGGPAPPRHHESIHEARGGNAAGVGGLPGP